MILRAPIARHRPSLSKSAQSGPALRARLFAAFESAPSANIRAEVHCRLCSPPPAIRVSRCRWRKRWQSASAGLIQDPQSDFFAETGVRIAALAGDEQSAWAWIDTGGERMRSWQLLLAASDPQGPRAEAALAAGIDIALKGGLPPPLLHRLVTVLDALDYEVPIPLWDAASKTPQPTDGRSAADRRAHQPEAGGRCRRGRAHRAARRRGVGAERRQGRQSDRARRCVARAEAGGARCRSAASRLRGAIRALAQPRKGLSLGRQKQLIGACAVSRHAERRARRRRPHHRGLYARSVGVPRLPRGEGQDATDATPSSSGAFSPGWRAKVWRRPPARASSPPFASSSAFCSRKGIRDDDPCSAIDSPRLGRPLPKILSFAEVETLLETAKQASETAAEGVPRRRARSGSMPRSRRSTPRACASRS